MTTPSVAPLFAHLGTVTVSATDKWFVAREKFVSGSAVKISFRGDNFQGWFLAKTEEPLAEIELRYAKLTRLSVDGPILTELGDKAESTLAQVWALMERQPEGKEGVLLTNGWANLFYVRDANGTLRAVHVGWGGNGWSVGAHSVANLYGWGVGRRVFSRNS